jgi:putative SOS response-associated peptidase YedK
VWRDSYRLNAKDRPCVTQWITVATGNRPSILAPNRLTPNRPRRMPASSFCEPNGDVKPATWHWFAVRGDEDRPLFAFPGIWKRYRGPLKKDGPTVEIETYSFLTTTPNSLISTVNHERMPVLLTREEEFDTWLRGSTDEALALAREFSPEQMRIVQVGLDKEDLLAA